MEEAVEGDPRIFRSIQYTYVVFNYDRNKRYVHDLRNELT